MGGWFLNTHTRLEARGLSICLPIAIMTSTDENDVLSSKMLVLVGIGQIPASSIDFAITALNFHDVYNRSEDGTHRLLRQIYSALKPGGVLGMVITRDTRCRQCHLTSYYFRRRSNERC